MPTEVRASHLLVRTEEEAKKLREEILNGASFAEMNGRRSKKTERRNFERCQFCRDCFKSVYVPIRQKRR